MSTLITKDMEEPKEYGPFLISTRTGKPLFIAHHCDIAPSKSWSDIEMNDCSWSELAATLNGGFIESLAARDARIRREALVCTDEECDVFTTEVDKAEQWVTPYAIREGLKAVTKFRERVS